MKSFEVQSYHLKALRQFSNTIVSKCFSEKQIQNAFKKFGYSVVCRDFIVNADDTHWIVWVDGCEGLRALDRMNVKQFNV